MIRADTLTKTYGATAAVDRLTMHLPPGSVTGVLGPNGAGKTTLVRLLLGLVRPTSGNGTVLGHDLGRDSLRIRQRAGLVPESKVLYRGATAGTFLDFHARFFAGADVSLSRRLLERWRIDAARGVHTLSRGERTKVLLAAVLAQRAPLMLLDEPTDGLDPESIEEVWGLLLERVASTEGAGALLCTHRLEEVERVCDRVVVLHRGSLVLEGVLDDLRETWRRLTMRLRGGPTPELPQLRAVAIRNGVLQAVASGWSASLREQLAAYGELLEAEPLPLREIYLTVVSHER